MFDNNDLAQGPVNTERAYRKRIELWLNRTKYTDFVAEIQKKVVGNSDAIETLCLSIWLYLERISKGLSNDSNVFLIGSSGVGKTELYRQIKNYFAREMYFLPVYHKDVSQISRISYVGAEPASIVDTLIDDCHYRGNGIGVVFCDECEKLFRSQIAAGGEDVGRTLQYQMLCIFEGTTIKGENNKDGSPRSIDSKNTLFIGMGSCMDIREQKSLNNKHKLGFSSATENNSSDEDEIITRADLLNYGATPELLGRFGTIINLKRLNDDEIRQVIGLLVKSEAESINIPVELDPSTIDKLLEDRDSPMGVRMYKSRIHDRLIEIIKQIKKGSYCSIDIEKIYLSEDGDKIIHNLIPFQEPFTNSQTFS